MSYLVFFCCFLCKRLGKRELISGRHDRPLINSLCYNHINLKV